MKQKSRAVLIVLSVILLLLIAGCGKKEEGISKASPFIGGSEGLELKFLQGAPPDEITNVNFPFQAIVSIKNVGEHDLTKEKVRIDLLGILESDFKGIGTANPVIRNVKPADNPTSRQKDSEGNIIEAVETFATIPTIPETAPSSPSNLQLASGTIQGNTKFTFRADVCYNYETNAIGSICVLTNMIDISDDAICSPKGPRPVSSSGSPIKVTALRQSVVGANKIQFSFDIVHSGSGSVFQDEALAFTETIGLPRAGCPKDPSNKRNKENKLDVTVATGILQELTCVGINSVPSKTGTVNSKEVRLTDGKRTITCTQEVPPSDFERNIDIKIKFNYMESIDKVVLAKHLGEPRPPGGGGGGACNANGICNIGETAEGCLQDCGCRKADSEDIPTTETECNAVKSIDKNKDRCTGGQTCKIKQVSNQGKCVCST